MWDTDSKQLFLLAAERVGWETRDTAVKEKLEALYLEYTRLCDRKETEWEKNATAISQELSPADWNDEDVDIEEDYSPALLSDWFAEEKKDEAEDNTKNDEVKDIEEQAKGAAEYYRALQEVTAVAKRTFGELEKAFVKGRPGNAEEQELYEKLSCVSRLDMKCSPQSVETALAALEEAAYSCMVSKKGFLGIRSGAAQKIQELAKESWALAGQAQVDLDLTAVTDEDPRSRIDVSVSLIKQMQQIPETGTQPSQSGRLQRLVRFDDLQTELKSMRQKRPPRN